MVDPVTLIAASIGITRGAAEIVYRYLDWQEQRAENRQNFLRYEAEVTCNVCGRTFSGLHGAAVHFGRMHQDIMDRGKSNLCQLRGAG